MTISFKILTFQEPIYTDIDDKIKRLEADYKVTFTDGDSDYRICIPKGYKTDGASVPQLFWSLGFTPTGLQMGAAVVHDALYQSYDTHVQASILPDGWLEVCRGGVWMKKRRLWTRAECDSLFLALMAKAGVPWYKRILMYQSVRLFGWLFERRLLRTA